MPRKSTQEANAKASQRVDRVGRGGLGFSVGFSAERNIRQLV